MKTIAVPGVVLIAFALGTQAQPTGGFGNEGRTEDGYSIKERGPHHRTWERLEVETTPMGTQVERKLSYTELETGMHYWQDNQWKEATEEIEILGDHALVTKAAHKVVFKANFADAGVIDLLTPDQKRFRSHILGLSYFDSASGESVLIAEPKESFGQVLPPNQVFFLDAFDDVLADVRYTVSKAGCEQDVIIRAQLPDPSALGLDPETTRLQVFTEFIEFPSPARRIIQAMRPGGLPDESLSFGAMRIEHSKAFAIGEGESAKKVRVFKQWATLEGRTFLIEELPLRNISAALQSLPQGRTASVTPRRKGQGENALLALKQFLPKRLASSATTKPIRLAESSLNRQPGFVLDYAILSGAADFTFQAGATYYCTNTVNLSGTTRIEGGTVVKFASNSTAQINISGDLVWATAAYRPAIFTAKDDNSTGETITGSTGNPTGFYGGGLHVYGYYSALNVLSNLCLLHLQNALNLGFDEAQQFTVANAQFVKCNTALSLMGSLNVNNALFYKIATNFNSSAGESLWVGHHLTVDQCEVFNNAYKATINLTNSLLAGVTNLDTSGYYWLYTNKVALLASDAGIFQTIGGGAHYLAANSPYRNAGTITGCVSHSSVPFTGNFYSSHSSPGNVNLNKLMTNAFWGLRGNLQGVFTACTARGERQGYMYDEHIFSQTACFSADMAAFFTKTIRDIRTNQAANGRYPVYAPFDNWPGVIDPPHGEDPGLQAGGLIFPWRMYQNYADGRMLVEHYRSASNWLAYCTNQFPTFYWKATNADGHSQFNVADWMHSYYDDHVPNWTPPSRPNRSGLEGTNWGTGWYAYSADTVAAMAQALETDAGSRGLWQAANMYAAEKSRYLDLAVQVRAAYLNLPLPWIRYDQNNKISGVFYNTQADCLAALIFNMVPDEQRENVWNILLNGSNGINNFNSFAQVTPRLSTGYYFSSQGMLELTRNGATPKAYDLLMDTGFRSWLYPVVNNFTTCWEGYSTWAATYGYHPSGHFRSFNHLPFGAVSEWVWRVVGGINLDQGQPGYQNVIIKPEPGGGLTNAFASFNSIHGPIVCTWTTNSLQTNYVLNVTVPANATGSIFIPSTNLARITESGGSAVNAIGVFSYYFTNAPNFPNATVFQVGSGSYNFNLSSN